MPISARGDTVLSGDFVGARLVDVANADQLRLAFLRKSGVDTRVLFAKVADADDCGSECHANSRLEAGVASRPPAWRC